MKRRIFLLADITVTIGKHTFQNPVFAASGTFGYGLENPDLVDISAFGAIVTKSITRQPREGNPPPRIVETPSGMINSIGLSNIGVDKYVSDMAPKYADIGCPVIMNIAGSSEDEYCEIVEITESVNSNIIGYEVNISCPNVKHGGIEFGVNAELTESLTSKIRKRTGKLVIMKLSPNVTDIRSIAMAAEAGGADALSAINTVYGMSINPHTKKSEIYTTYGGLSGPAIKPVGLACVHKVSLAVDVPVIGIGGITSGKDAVEYILAGASAIQVGTANYRDPATGISILDDLKRYLAEQNIATVAEMIGMGETYES